MMPPAADPGGSTRIADIGGTNAGFALVLPNSDDPAYVRTLSCTDYPDFIATAEAYLSGIDSRKPVTGLCVIAASVTGDRLRMTNSAWAFSIEQARIRLGLNQLRFVNDLVAQALAVPHLTAEEIDLIGGGEPRCGYPIAVLGAGTGLGVSGLIPSAAG